MFSLVGSLPSTTSAASACCSVALFVCFIGTPTRSDSSPPCVLVLRPGPLPAGLPLSGAVNDEVSRFSCMQFLGVPGVYDYAGSPRGLAFTSTGVWPSPSVHRVGIPLVHSRSAMPSPPIPLFTLRLPPCAGTRKTRGQDASLFLSSHPPSLPPTCRSIPSHQQLKS